jgi:TatA/E family protein of Tat protein translocase
MDFFANPLHLILLLVVILIVFGAGKLPSVGSALGQSIREFKKATAEDDPKPAGVARVCTSCQTLNLPGAQFCADCGTTLQPQVTAAPTNEIFCTQCGAKNPATGRFCVQCGTGLNARAS